MATHTWVSDDVRDQALAANSQMSDVEIFASLKTEGAETLARWIGHSDFFCHWYATSADAIFEALEATGLNDLMVTMSSEMQPYINADATTGNELVNPFDQVRWQINLAPFGSFSKNNPQLTWCYSKLLALVKVGVQVHLRPRK